MANRVEQLAGYILTKAQTLGLTLKQLCLLTTEQVNDALPAQYKSKVSHVVLRKGLNLAIGKAINARSQQLANDSTFKTTVDSTIKGLVITDTDIKQLIRNKLEALKNG